MKNSKFKGNLIFASALVGLFSTCAMSAHAESMEQQNSGIEDVGLQENAIVDPAVFNEFGDVDPAVFNEIGDDEDQEQNENEAEKAGKSLKDKALKKVNKIGGSISKVLKNEKTKKVLKVASSTAAGTISGRLTYDLGKEAIKKVKESFRTLPENEIEQPQITKNSEENKEVNTQESNQGNQPGTKTENEKNTKKNTEVNNQGSNQGNQPGTKTENEKNTKKNTEVNNQESNQDNLSNTNNESKQYIEVKLEPSVEQKLNIALVLSAVNTFLFVVLIGCFSFKNIFTKKQQREDYELLENNGEVTTPDKEEKAKVLCDNETLQAKKTKIVNNNLLQNNKSKIHNYENPQTKNTNKDVNILNNNLFQDNNKIRDVKERKIEEIIEETDEDREERTDVKYDNIDNQIIEDFNINNQ